MSRRGLPATLKMRHDAHYVEELTANMPTPLGRYIAVSQLEPNPEQPRTEFGDMSELTASIAERGVLEPLLVRRISGAINRWMIIAGERRWRAACAAGLEQVPCVELEVNESDVAEIALIENLQRKDLTIWEEADGLLVLSQRFGYTHEDIAQKMGKSRTSITETLAIANMPKPIREQCLEADISSKSLLLQIVRQPTEEMMQELVARVAKNSMTRDGARAASKAMNEKGAVGTSENTRKAKFKFKAPDQSFELTLTFANSEATPKQISEALKIVNDSLEIVG